MDGQAKFLEGNLFRHITVMSLTASVGLMAVFIVDFVDMIFISMLGKAELAAAIGYAGAILFFTSSFGIGMAIAAGALVSRALGAGDEELARRRATNTLIYGVIFGAVFAFGVWMNLAPLSALMGASGETLDLSISYLAIIIPSLPFLLMGMVGSAILRAYGDARRAMMATVWGGLVNAVLDPILIFGLDLDLTGAATNASGTLQLNFIQDQALQYLLFEHADRRQRHTLCDRSLLDGLQLFVELTLENDALIDDCGHTIDELAGLGELVSRGERRCQQSDNST